MPAYIRAMGTTEEQVKVCQERQAVLDQEGTDLSIIISESALRRRVDSHVTMRDQLRHLVDVEKSGP